MRPDDKEQGSNENEENEEPMSSSLSSGRMFRPSRRNQVAAATASELPARASFDFAQEA